MAEEGLEPGPVAGDPPRSRPEAAQAGSGAEAAAVEPTPTSASPRPGRGQVLDPSRPLRMPGASLREPQRPVLLEAMLGLIESAKRKAERQQAREREREKTGVPDAIDPPDVPARETASTKPARRRDNLALEIAIGGLIAFAVGTIALVLVRPDLTENASTVETTQAVEPAAAPTTATDAGVSAAADAAAVEAPAPNVPKVFRVRSLADDPDLEIVEGTIGKRPVLAALTASGLSMKDAFRAIHSFKNKTFDRPAASDAFVYARHRKGGRLVAFEYIVPPFDVWQAREGDDGKLEGKKVEFTPELRRVARSVVVGDDLRKSLAQAELDDDLLGMLDDALDGHAELVDMRPGARLRVVVVEERIEGAFARYGELDAVEYLPANPKAKPVRVYRFDPDGMMGKNKKKAHVFFDGEGRQPYKGGFRTPLPLGRVTSRFNPRRMHPVLHVIMPHNGVDYAAPIGTPIYATASGVVKVSSFSGPNGNMVQIQHPNGLVSAYCHLSRFAAGLHPGQHVESRQLVGYVGQTGRSTGPHLHFAVKRGEVFLDPLSLRLDGVRTLPPGDREAFDKARAELDSALDSIALPPAPAGVDTGHEATETEDVIYDDLAADAGAAVGPSAAADGAAP